MTTIIEKYLSLDKDRDAWTEAHEQAQSAGRPDGWLDGDAVARACEFLKISPERSRACAASVACINADPERRQCAWTLFHHVFIADAADRPGIGRFPSLRPDMQEACPMFWAVILLAGLDITLQRHRERGIPAEVSIDTLGDLENWMAYHERRTGGPGFGEQNWLVRHFRGRIYQLGRLQFELHKWWLPFHLLAEPAGDGVTAIAAAGLTMRPDGQFDGVNGISAGEAAWTTRLDEDDEKIAGYAVRDGAVGRELIELDKSQWRPVVRPRDDVLYVHIPDGQYKGRMTAEACMESYARAEAFFADHFPEYRYMACATETWLLDPQLRRVLRDDSNIVQFQRHFLLLPVPKTNDQQTLQRVFNVSEASDLDALPQKTSLQKSMLQQMRQGIRWRRGGGIRLRSNWKEIDAERR